MVNGSVDPSPRTTCCRDDDDGSDPWDEVSVYSWVKMLCFRNSSWGNPPLPNRCMYKLQVHVLADSLEFFER